MFIILKLSLIIIFIICINGLNTINTNKISLSPLGRISGARWCNNNINNIISGNNHNFHGFDIEIISSSEINVNNQQQQYIPTSLSHIGDLNNNNDNNEINSRKANFYLNVGKALDTLRRELPMVFATSNLDFSIFANSITVTDGNQNKIVMSRSLYAAAIKSVQMASAFSSIYPSMNVKKIEYIEDCATIQCLVDVVLPDNVRIEGSAVWEGVFYFGIDNEGLVNTHIFDRKISTLRPSSPISASSMPWLRAGPQWSQDLLTGRRIPGLVKACGDKIECNQI